jgi:alpha-L-rhamnosidase
MHPSKTLLLAAALALVLAVPATQAKELTPVALRCEYRVNPQGVDEAQPRLTWRVEASARGAIQTAYQILVASSGAGLAANVGDLWDSGRVEGDQTVNVVYSGKPLGSGQQCVWKVRVWDAGGHPCWSAPASWTMGLLQPSDWRAEYITFHDPAPVWTNTDQLYLPPAHQLRKEFATAKTVKRATIYATALGIYELYLNGRRVGDARFAPGWTDYRQRAYYNTYDVTPLVRRGRNALGGWLGDG